MTHNPRMNWFLSLVALMILLGTANGVNAQQPDKPFLTPETTTNVPHLPPPQGCTGPVSRVIDTGWEGVRVTPFNFGVPGGGGEGGRFDPTPILSIPNVALTQGVCLNAHLSAIVGSAQTYGVSNLTFFQVTLTPVGGGPATRQHMYGHYETPYGIYGPAVALEAERDVDMYGSNFFSKVGTLKGEVPPGVYNVDVWWAGGPATPGGAIGAGFVLKLYLR